VPNVSSLPVSAGGGDALVVAVNGQRHTYSVALHGYRTWRAANLQAEPKNALGWSVQQLKQPAGGAPLPF
jgi:hypothetical protein